MSRYAPQPFKSDGTRVEYKKPSETAWSFIPGVGDITLSGGEPPSNEVNTFQASFRTFGRSTPPSITMTLPGISLSHKSYTDLVEAQTGGSELQFRWGQPEVVLFGPTASGITIAIATDGSITIAGAATSHPNLVSQSGVGPGTAIKVGTAYYVIDTIPENGLLTGATLVENPSSAVSASVYSLVVPPVRQPSFSATVSAVNVTRSAGNSASGSLTLGLVSTLAAEEVGTF